MPERSDNHEFYMRRCLQTAQNGLGHTAPNPMVGAVLTYEGKIVAEGFHRKFGMPHAEVEAISKVRDAALLKHCTLYVNLEPCCHYGKTPPCAELIIKSGILRVLTAMQDPFPKVSGGGVEMLRQSGVEVLTGILHNEALTLNRRFLTYHTKNRPYVILKWAQTADGYIDRIRTASAVPTTISNATAQRLNHLWRTQEQAILVGANTAIMDNPLLTARLCNGKNPLRAVVCSSGKLPPDLSIFNSNAPSVILKTHNPAQMLNILYQREIQSVIVEGGALLLQSFIDANLWDETRIITAPQRFGKGIPAPNIAGIIIMRELLMGNTLEVIRPNN